MQYIMDNLNLFFAKKGIPTTKGTESEHTAVHPADNAMKSNLGNYANDLMNKQNCLQ